MVLFWVFTHPVAHAEPVQSTWPAHGAALGGPSRSQQFLHNWGRERAEQTAHHSHLCFLRCVYESTCPSTGSLPRFAAWPELRLKGRKLHPRLPLGWKGPRCWSQELDLRLEPRPHDGQTKHTAPGWHVLRCLF